MDKHFPIPGATDGFVNDDWRSGAPQARSPQGRPRSAPGSGALHIGARRASLAQERSRAREIVAVARSRLGNTFDEVRFGRALSVETLWPLVSSITASVARHPAAIIGVTRMKERHEYTYLHSVAVCGLMIGLARRLEIDPTLHHDIGMAGLLHDIGKARVPTMLLDKPDSLSDYEHEIVRGHAVWGYEMLIGGERLSDIVLDVCLHHHERIDGDGYPDGFIGEQVSRYARMAAICDVYDSLTSTQVYRAAWSPAEALEWMRRQPGRFDPAILAAFSLMIGIFPMGSLVRLQSERLAIVLDDPDGDPAHPAVCAFYCIQSRQPLGWRRIDGGADPIIGIELAERWNIGDWPETRRQILATFASTPAD